MVDILTYISLITGGFLVLLLLLSILGGLDLELDVGSGDVDADTGGGLGIIKGFLTFVSVSSWMIKVLLAAKKNAGIAVAIGIFCGILAFVALNYLLRILIKNDTNVNWEMDDALFKNGKVYLRVPGEEGSGLVHVDINGVNRELKAKSFDNSTIATGEAITVMDIKGEFVIVKKEH